MNDNNDLTATMEAPETARIAPGAIPDGAPKPAPEKPARALWKARLALFLDDARAVAGSRTLTALNAMLLAVVLIILLSSDRSVLSGSVIVAWGALACFLSYLAGSAQDEQVTGLRVVLAYALASLVLFLVMNGLYRLFGV